MLNNLDFYKKFYPESLTKSTLNHEAIPYIYESIKTLIDLDIKIINMTIPIEDIWAPDDDKILYDQLIKTADYIIDNKLYKSYFISLFDIKFVKEVKNYILTIKCSCGTSSITADYKGNLFPCLRFKTLSGRKPVIIGNIDTEIDYKKLLPFYFCYNLTVPDKCKICEYNIFL